MQKRGPPTSRIGNTTKRSRDTASDIAEALFVPDRIRKTFLDIENTPARGFFYDRRNPYNIVWQDKPQFILSVAYKHSDEDKIHCLSLPQFPGYRHNKYDDKPMLLQLAEDLKDTHILVAHNGDNFDLKKIRTRMLLNNIPPFAPRATIDTLKIAKREFGFLSNKLTDLASEMGIGRKLPTHGTDTWRGCLNGDMKEWRIMERYNKHDVYLLEEVYKRFLPFITNHPNLNIYAGDGHRCPKCLSANVRSNGVRYTATQCYRRYICGDCGGWSRGQVIKHDPQLR